MIAAMCTVLQLHLIATNAFSLMIISLLSNMAIFPLTSTSFFRMMYSLVRCCIDNYGLYYDKHASRRLPDLAVHRPLRHAMFYTDAMK